MAKLSQSSPVTNAQSIAQLRDSLGLPSGPVLNDAGGLEITNIELNHIAENLDVLAPQEFSSHRKGLGAVIVGLKVLICRVLRPVIQVTMGRQWALNYYIYHNAAMVERMTRHIKELEARIERLERKGG